jgi:hypothetical protein
MTSDHTTNSQRVDAHRVATGNSLARLSLKPSGSAGGAVDGAWWPRSRDPAIELGALIEELGTQRTPVRGIALTRVGWDSAPRRIRLASGRKVAVDWSPTGHMIRIIDTNYQRIDLLVIPVNTTPASAELALTMATDGHDPHISAISSPDPGSGCLTAKARAFPANEKGTSNRRVPDRTSDNPPSDVVGRRRVVLLPHSPAEQIDLPPSPIARTPATPQRHQDGDQTRHSD